MYKYSFLFSLTTCIQILLGFYTFLQVGAALSMRGYAYTRDFVRERTRTSNSHAAANAADAVAAAAESVRVRKEENKPLALSSPAAIASSHSSSSSSPSSPSASYCQYLPSPASSPFDKAWENVSFDVPANAGIVLPSLYALKKTE